MASCVAFARHIKLSGTGPERASLQWVQAALDDLGFRTILLTHDAYISLPGPARVVVDGQDVPAITHSFSRPSQPGGLTAQLVDLGDRACNASLRGCIALVDGIANPADAARLLREGAVGQLHVSPHEHLHEMCISPVWGNPGLQTLGQLPATVACTISRADGEALRDRLCRGEAPVVTLHAEVDTGWRPTPLLVADMEAQAVSGAEPDEPFVLLSGHHDTWHYGVMDNGSANATMLECARVLAGQRAAWRRGLRLCFWSGHSHGRYSGSAWYADTHWGELHRRCAAHVNVDSTGGVGATDMTQAAAAAELTPLAAAVIQLEAGAAHGGRRLGRNSDNSFWGIGVPTMFGSVSHQPSTSVPMRNSLGWWWHTPHDLLDKVDEANLVRDTRVVAAALWRLLADPVLPLDYAAHAGALLAELSSLDAALRGVFPLGPLMDAAATVRDAAAALLHADPARANRALMLASRALVPLDYTAGDRFTHDPALPQAPWPVLDPIRTLSRCTEAERPFAVVDATRARNRVLHALQDAARALHLS